jgi:sensor domain CHASE-containing protein
MAQFRLPANSRIQPQIFVVLWYIDTTPTAIRTQAWIPMKLILISVGPWFLMH